MIEKVDIAIVGATTSIGETLVDILQERKFPVGDIFLLDSEGTSGSRIEFKGQALKIGDVKTFDFAKVQIAFFVTSESVAQEYAPVAAGKNCIVIDRSAAFRNNENVPLVIPEVNAEDIEKFSDRNIISSPGCTTIQMLLALKPIHDAFGIKSINLSTYQSVSGSGKDAAEELASQTTALLNFRDVKCKTYSKQIAFNVIPLIGELQENGYSAEEIKVVMETQKILKDKNIHVNPTAVRVPVFIGHAASVHIKTNKPISINQTRELLQQAEGIELLVEQAGDLPTPVTEAAGTDAVFVGRLRKDIMVENGLNLWVVTDNLRKGGALNIAQIAEILVKQYL